MEFFTRGITNLHVPSDVTVDASTAGGPIDSIAGGTATASSRTPSSVIPDHSYADLYAEAVERLPKRYGTLTRAIGATPNVGLMTTKAGSTGPTD